MLVSSMTGGQEPLSGLQPVTEKYRRPLTLRCRRKHRRLRFRVRCPIPGADPMTSRAGGLPPFRTRLTGPVRCGGAKRLAFGRACPDLIRGLTPRGTSRPPPPAGYFHQDDATWWNLAGSHRRGCGWGASPLLRKKWRISRSAAEAIRQPRDRLKRQPQERQHSAAVFGGTRDRLPPARGAVPLASWDRSPSGPKPPLGGFVLCTRARPRRGTPDRKEYPGNWTWLSVFLWVTSVPAVTREGRIRGCKRVRDVSQSGSPTRLRSS